MSSEITYAEVKFKNEFKSSGSKSEPPAAPKEKTSFHKSNSRFLKLLLVSLLIFLLLLGISFSIAFAIYFQKYSQSLMEEHAQNTTKEIRYTTLECMKENFTRKAQVWSCCPKDWTSFGSYCYIVPSKARNWNESEKHCSEMHAHLLVMNTKDDKDFVTQKLDRKNSYYIGLSDPEGKKHWQWVDQTPYNESLAFWHPGEPNNPSERCAMLSHLSKRWGWNNIYCDQAQFAICKTMKIYI
ncbi:PREDICTED: C-type lectin domain family 4 member A [Ceratotherium simum simum]|uniref:C-type lectin domain family 4 member A n=1 Tax=Ceratotherium simum simum TaxID=73337 RepID=A0ABM0I272_CERSS|nr:PREDICTED: C-type lectin domain family 4 member A [Ceratotherium simum simum]